MTDLLWALIALQIAMGGFDTFFHHEFTERLPWRPSQRQEMRLHGVRNLIYSAVFVLLGWTQPQGWFAYALLAGLFIELIITLIDFVEEDRTRKLPGTERVLHTVLALNYGAILALFTPVLLEWGGRTSSIDVVNYGLWSWLTVPAAVGTLVCGFRDLAAAKRLETLGHRSIRKLIPAFVEPKTVLVTGGTGFIGTRLVEALVSAGHNAIVLTREAEHASHLAQPVTVITDLDQIANAHRIDAIVNLAGHSIAGGLWTSAFKKKVKQSRIQMTRDLLELVKRLDHTPDCVINGSAVGAYSHQTDGPVDEATPVRGDGSFSEELCHAWETVAEGFTRNGVRTVILRLGMVLDWAGGPLGQMLIPFEWGAGGPFGNGKHMMSWISRDDAVRIILTALEDTAYAGPVNAVAPRPISNKCFASALGEALNRPSFATMPSWVLTTLLGDLGREIFLADQSVHPTKLKDYGYVFLDPNLESVFQPFSVKRPECLRLAAQPATARE